MSAREMRPSQSVSRALKAPFTLSVGRKYIKSSGTMKFLQSSTAQIGHKQAVHLAGSHMQGTPSSRGQLQNFRSRHGCHLWQHHKKQMMNI